MSAHPKFKGDELPAIPSPNKFADPRPLSSHPASRETALGLLGLVLILAFLGFGVFLAWKYLL